MRKAYLSALKSEPNNLDAHRCLAGLHFKCNEFDPPSTPTRRRWPRTPTESILWYDVAMVHARKKDMAELAPLPRQGLEMDPENRDYMKKLGFTLAWMGQIDQDLDCTLLLLRGPGDGAL